MDFPASSSANGVFVSVQQGSRFADRPLPGGLDTYLAFSLEGSIIGQGGIPVGKLDKAFTLSTALSSLHLPGGAKIFRWNENLARWDPLSSATSVSSDLLTDYAIGGPPRPRTTALTLASSPMMAASAGGSMQGAYTRGYSSSELFTLSSGTVDYLGGYLDLPGSGYNGFSAVGAEDGYWAPGNVGKLNSQPRQLVQASDGTFYSLGEDGYLRRSDDGYTWKELRKSKEDTLPNYRIVQIRTDGTTLLAAMTTDSNNTDQSGYYKSTDRGDS
ncbi:MAG: hypothetical protein M1319_06120, partial [Chloroflexi bacterium]|nr:hypothetical protein [Chloroflexota bacterium]